MSATLALRLRQAGIRDERVLEAIARVPRHLFVPAPLREEADEDRALPIGLGQTISQPYVVAFMTERLALRGDERVLEIGTGSGYQTAILALLARDVFSIELVPELAERARAMLLGTLGLPNVHLRHGDGGRGWPEEAPFDAILVAAAAPEVPDLLVSQLAPGGRMIVPVAQGGDSQVLRLLVRGDDGVTETRDVLPVRFVPLVRPG